jgi:mannose-6-phosphate isomerase-like protein (cupin superfamily)
MRILLFIATCLALTAAWAQHTIVKPDEIKWMDVPSLPPGAKIAVLEGKMSEAGPITARLKFPANYRLPPHFHPGVERVTVLSGTLNFGMDDKFDRNKTTALGPGSLLIMPPKMSHFLWTTGEAIAQINVIGPWSVTYVDPADDPRKKRAD